MVTLCLLLGELLSTFYIVHRTSYYVHANICILLIISTTSVFLDIDVRSGS